MNAPSNVVLVDDVLRVVRRPGLGRDCVTSLRELPRARCRQWPEILRPVTGVKSQAIRLHMLMNALCGVRLVRVVGNGLNPCVQSQVRRPR